MGKFFYAKLALTNLKKNSKTYIPYILTCIGTITMYYLMHFISRNDGLDSMSGGTQLKIILNLGNFVIAIFAIIFLFYTNSFLIKRRKKEFGLFNILGMEKKHIARVMVWETLFVSLVSLIVGLVTGLVTSKMMFLLLLKILNFAVPFGFFISWDSVIATTILFSIIFILSLLNNLRQIHLAKPIELIKGGQTGEKEPKTKWILVLFGILTLGGGYYIALTTESPLAAINLFFIAVILVIIGTYALFTAGTIALLKLLRKNKNFYYQTKHFISVSGMIYRMKQNAVGLANICVLATMVLVMVSTTVSLYVGMEDLLRHRYPRNISVSAENVTAEDAKRMDAIILDVAENHKVGIKNTVNYRYSSLAAIQEGHSFSIHPSTYVMGKEIALLSLMPLSEYNKIENKSETLAANEVLLFTLRGTIDGNKIDLSGNKFHIKERLQSLNIDGSSNAMLVDTYFLIVPDEQTIISLQKALDTNSSSGLSYYYGFDTDSSPENEVALTYALRDQLRAAGIDAFSEGAEESRESFFSLYGGLFFLGIFLGALFIMATVLIIYYKQISEGYDDKSRFEIMQKVGLSKNEVKKSIKSQVLIVFFLPLVMAVVHIAFAFKVITKLLALLNLTNVTLFAITTAGAILVFALFYAIVYSLTAREYYKIVS